MSRVKTNVARLKRRKKLLKSVRGAYLGRSKHYRHALQTKRRALVYATRDRKVKKRDFRQKWILTLNAACRANGIMYSRFINGLHKAKIGLDRKALAYIAVNDPSGFTELTIIATGS
jgi:large subunit ribosomal protein L20